MSSKSFMAKKETFEPEWLLIDADDQVVGRLATRLATILMGKHKPTYTPHTDTGDFVVVINADRVKFGADAVAHEKIANYSAKMAKKLYHHWTGYPGGLKAVTGEQMMVKKPEEVLIMAVRRMLPKSKLGRAMLKKLKVFRGAKHDHTAQQPKPVEV
jgi:large subunit ribosomal protein L13